MRPAREDFHPGRYYSDRLPRSLWDWPLSYETLEPYYDEAEQLYGVAGASEDDFGETCDSAGFRVRRRRCIR